MVTGVALFVLVAHISVRPTIPDPALTPIVTNVLLGMALAACGVSLWLRKRVPQRSTDESADLFWTRALQSALIAWAPAEIGGLLAVVAYMLTGAMVALPVVGIALLMFFALRPASLEKA